MKFKASYFSVSKPLVTENLRRFWALSAVSFLTYFLSGIFPILMQYGYENTSSLAHYVEMCLGNYNPFFMVLLVAVPVVASVLVFRYMHQSASTSSLHAMPFSRAKLYNSNILSGLILSLIPIIVTGIILLIIAKPVYYSTTAHMLPEDAINVFARVNVLRWILDSCVIVIFVYAISVFGGIVSGNAIMHLLAALGFNFLVPALAFLVTVYADLYLFGYYTNSEFILWLTPVIKLIARDSLIGVGAYIIYIVVAVLIIIGSAALYHKRKHERAGDALVFRFMITFVCYIISLFGMSLLGAYFNELGYGGKLDMYIGFAAGTLLFFIIGRMIVLKTPRIFNMRTLRSLGCYCLVAVLFISTFAFDFTGYEKRIPDTEKIGAAYSTGMMAMIERLGNHERFNSNAYKQVEADKNFTDAMYANSNKHFRYSGDGRVFFEPENIDHIRAIHQDIIDNKAVIEASGENDRITIPAEYDSRYMSFSLRNVYYVNGDKEVQRRYYSIPYELIAENEHVKALYESNEFKEKHMLSNLDYSKINTVTINNILRPGDFTFTGEEAMELMAAMDRDLADRMYEEETDVTDSGFVFATIEYMRLGQSDGDKNVEFNDAMQFTILESDKNTIAWLNAHGAEEVFNDNSEYITEVRVTKCGEVVSTYTETMGTVSADIATVEYKYSESEAKVVDRDQIEYIVENGHGQTMMHTGYYACYLYRENVGEYTISQLEYMFETGQIDYEYYEKLLGEYGIQSVTTLFIPFEEAPDFIEALFE